MKLVPTSLGGRLLLGSGIVTVVTLAFALLLMDAVLNRFVTGQIDQRLDNKIVQLSSQLRVLPDHFITLDGDADGPPFDKPQHRSFWWIRGPRNDLHTAWLAPADYDPPSASDLDRLPAPPPPPPNEEGGLNGDERPHTMSGRGPDGSAMHVRVASRTIDGVRIAIIVAAPVAAIDGPMREAMTTVGVALTFLGAALVLAAFLQSRFALRPLARLRDDVAHVRNGLRGSLPISQPGEVLPLTLELNSLLEQNAANLKRARTQVANLAHGIKTPLATMALTVERMEGAERPALRELVNLIERRVRHHLGRARAAAIAGPSRLATPLEEHLRAIGDALGRIHVGRRVAFEVDCPAGLMVACEAQDVDEILGNLLDNAFKYSESRVACSVRGADRDVTIEIVDDGPGLTLDEIERVVRPGQRLDESVPGHGFGLPIAAELIELYAGKLRLERRNNEFVVSVVLPRAQ